MYSRGEGLNCHCLCLCRLIDSSIAILQGAALSAMVGWMTFGKKKYEDLDSTMRKLIPPIYKVMNDLIPLVDEDTNAFNLYMVRIII